MVSTLERPGRILAIRLSALALLGVLLATTVIALDWLFGEVTGIVSVREDARRFKSQAAPLLTSARSLAPNLQHEYPKPYRPEGDELVPRSMPRRFATTPEGTVASDSPGLATGLQIVFLGGSTTECNEVDEPFRFPSVVGRALSEAGAPITAVNAGVRGHTTLDAITLFLHRPQFAQADVVVLMENINDRLRLALRGDYRADAGDAPPTSIAAVSASLSQFLSAVSEYAVHKSNALFFLQSLLERVGMEGGWISERSLDELPLPSAQVQEQYAQNLRLFVAVVRAIGKAPVLMTQPLGRASPAQDLFNERIRSVARETGVMLVDLDAELMRDRKWAFLDDDIHFSNRGSLAIGHLIASRVAPLVGKEYTAPRQETGLTSISAVTEQCLPFENGQVPIGARRLHQIVSVSARYPSISGDGRWLLFQSRVGHLDRLRVLRVEDHQLFELTPETIGTHERHPAFLTMGSDGFEVVFGGGKQSDDAPDERLFVRHWPSGAQRPLYNDNGLNCSIPSVSRNHVYCAGNVRRDGPVVPNLFRYDLRESRMEQITRSESEEWRPYPSASGDLFFISNPAGRFAIYRLGAGSGKPDLFVSSKADEWDPAVSPDGRWLAFASRRHGTWDIFMARTADPSDAIRLTDSSDDEWDPSWHPNGRALVLAGATENGSRLMALCPFGERPARVSPISAGANQGR